MIHIKSTGGLFNINGDPMKILSTDEVKIISGGAYTMTVEFDVPPNEALWMGIAASSIASGTSKTTADLQMLINNLIKYQNANFDSVVVHGIYFTNIY